MTSAHTKLWLLCGILWAAAVCSGQDTTSTQATTGPYKIGGGVSPPRLIYKVEPEYSEEGRRSRLEGTVMLRVCNLQVLHSVGMGLDEKAIAAASRWLFKPGEKDGQPVNVFAQIEVNFRLGDKASRWHLVRAEFHLPPGATRPVIEKGPAPRIADDAVNANATATFDINENGEAFDVHIDKASDDQWGRDVTNALRKWRFTAAAKDGKPVSASCTMEFVRGTI